MATKQKTQNIDNEAAAPKPVQTTSGPVSTPDPRYPTLEKGQAASPYDRQKTPDPDAPNRPWEGPRGADLPTTPPPYNPAAPDNKWMGMRNDAIREYGAQKFGYNPYLNSAGPQMQGMNYNPYQSAAMNGAQSQSANQFASAQSMLHQTGGMSAADRMKSFSDFNRAKITGQLGATQNVDQMANQNATDVGRYNAQRSMDVNQSNVAAQNNAYRMGAQGTLNRQQNLYEGALAERNINRQLEASRLISQNQQGSTAGGGPFDKLLNPIWNNFDGIFGG